jgi:hypothetical protein
VVTEVVEASPANVFTPETPSLQACVDCKIRITFDDARPTPVNCSEHVSVRVHAVASTYGPEIWNEPKSNK